MNPSCKDCRFYSRWSLRCSEPNLVQHYGGGQQAAVTMRDLDEACGSNGRRWSGRPGIVYSAVDWLLKKTGMKDY